MISISNDDSLNISKLADRLIIFEYQLQRKSCHMICIYHYLKHKNMSVKQIDGYKIYFNKKLGQGSYGTVYVAISDTTHEEVAVKMMPKKSSNYLNLFS